MTDFFRFPHTPHLAWLGEGVPRDDKVLSPEDAQALLKDRVIVEEKVDGANLGISLAPNGDLRAQNRGQYLREPYAGQFSRLHGWLGQHGKALTENLEPHLILFGEWCAARHSLDYDRLPDWFLVFDVYDRRAGRFWSKARRDSLTTQLGLVAIACVYEGKTDLPHLRKLLHTAQSCYREGPPEGFVIRRDEGDWSGDRAKLVRAEFAQSIADHWRGRSITWNRLRC